VRTAVITLAHGRHGHLRRQIADLARGTRTPDVHVIVAMDDPTLAAVAPSADIVQVSRVDGELPLAAARNAGAARARRLGATLLVLLDVDCVPAPQMLERYVAAAGRHDGVLSGPVGYLPPPPADGYPAWGLAELARPHPARPVPAEDEIWAAEDLELFWSLSFALRADTWERLGGFCEDFYGYGGEDTDFGQVIARAGVGLWWVGGAWAFHQHHGDGGAPVRHLDAVLRNAAIFHRRWGWWPMRGWLAEFDRMGLAALDPATGTWVRT